MKFNFIIDDYQIALNLLRNGKVLFDDKLNDFLSINYKNEYKYLYSGKVYDTQEFKNLSQFKILDEIIKNPIFKECKQKCLENVTRMQKTLKSHQKEIEEYLKTLARTTFPNLDLNVYVVFKEGFSQFGTNNIFFGSQNGETDQFYDIVYLYHEAMHKLFEFGNISHTIIEELADKRLAKHFAGKEYEGHEFLIDTHKEYEDVFSYYFEGKDSPDLNTKAKKRMNKKGYSIFNLEKELILHDKKRKVSLQNIDI